uniref:Amine oxidase domain-containing protein n=1 Tax=Phaeomonas parva TaxID=124430 RepID=A0A6U4CWI0_9STRA
MRVCLTGAVLALACAPSTSFRTSLRRARAMPPVTRLRALETPDVDVAGTAAPASAAGAAQSGGGKSVTIVGAGVGSLVSAALLAQDGYKVEIFEKNPEDQVGGRINQAVIEGCRFELGPSLLLLPDVYRKTFAACGLDLDEEMTIARVDPTYKAYFDDGTGFVLDPRDPDFKGNLEAIEAGSYEQYKKYMESAEINLEGGWPNFIEEKLTLDVLPKFIANALTPRNFPLLSHNQHLKQYFKTKKLNALFSFQDLYVGLSPYNAPAVFSLLTAIELSDGVYYPIGGFHQIPKALRRRCEELGVKFNFGAGVKKISVEGRAAAGVELDDGRSVESDLVIANPDLPFVEETMIPAEKKRHTENMEYSTPVVSFYFATDKRFDALGHHTICLSTDYERSWDDIVVEGKFPPNFNFYVHAPSRTDPSVIQRPGGEGDSIMVLVPTPPLPAGIDDAEKERISQEWYEQARAGVIKQFGKMPGMQDFEKHIVGEQVRTPADWGKLYNMNRGAVFGLSCKISQLSFLRPSPRHPNIDNLYFVGASTRPGNGVPLVMTGARLLHERIMREAPVDA